MGEGVAVGADRPLEQHRRPAALDQPGADLGHLQHGRDGLGHAHELAAGFQPLDEVAQGSVRHGAAKLGGAAPCHVLPRVAGLKLQAMLYEVDIEDAAARFAEMMQTIAAGYGVLIKQGDESSPAWSPNSPSTKRRTTRTPP